MTFQEWMYPEREEEDTAAGLLARITENPDFPKGRNFNKVYRQIMDYLFERNADVDLLREFHRQYELYEVTETMVGIPAYKI